MVSSILDDIKREFTTGNRITRLILINVGVFVSIGLVKVFTHFPGAEGNVSMFSTILDYITLNKDWIFNFTHPWVFMSHMFLHIGLWHLVWNMILLYIFGRRVGDLIGDKHVYPLYIYGGLASAIILLLSISSFGYVSAEHAIHAHGASGAVMAFVVALGIINPDGVINLILLGPVRIKYIVATLVLLNILSLGSDPNTGGIFGHLGGAAMGWFYIYALRNGWNLSPEIPSFKSDQDPKIKVMSDYPRPSAAKKTTPSKSFRQYFTSKDEQSEAVVRNIEEEVDRILDKIIQSGKDSLTDEERETLQRASKDK